jgi:hypothetical protein
MTKMIDLAKGLPRHRNGKSLLWHANAGIFHFDVSAFPWPGLQNLQMEYSYCIVLILYTGYHYPIK